MGTRKNKFSINFKGFEEYMEKLDRLGRDLKKPVTEALDETAAMIETQVSPEMVKHKRTGRTENAILRNSRTNWEGLKGTVDVGFDIWNGGWASIYLMYGTQSHGPIGAGGGHPGTAADKALWDAVFGTATKRKIDRLQKNILQKYIDERMR